MRVPRDPAAEGISVSFQRDAVYIAELYVILRIAEKLLRDF